MSAGVVTFAAAKTLSAQLQGASSKENDELAESPSLKRVATLKVVEADEKVGRLTRLSSREVAQRKEIGTTAVSDAEDVAVLGQLVPTFGSETVILANDGTISSFGGLSHVFPRGALISSGCHYYEVTLIDHGEASHGAVVVGWAKGTFSGAPCSGNVVDTVDAHSQPVFWGFDVANTCIVTRTEQGSDAGGTASRRGRVAVHSNLTLHVRTGDVVGCSCNAGTGVIDFFVNGNVVGSVQSIPAKSSSWTECLIPTISLQGKYRARVNFGAQPMNSLPTTCVSVNDWVCRKRESIIAQSCGGRYGKLVPTSGSTGLVISGRTATFQNGFPSCKLAGVLLTRGKWYYEVKILKAGEAVQLGWCDLDFHGSSATGIGVGDDKCSWAFDGVRAPGQGAWHTGPRVFGKKWKAGDVVGCALDLDLGSISYSLNGNFDAPMGCVWTGISFRGGLAPALTSNHNFACVFNWGANSGQPGGDEDVVEGLEALLQSPKKNRTAREQVSTGFAFSCPEGYKPVAVWLKDHDPTVRTEDQQASQSEADAPRADLDSTLLAESSDSHAATETGTSEESDGEAKHYKAIPDAELSEKYQDVADMGFDADSGWSEADVKKLLVILAGDVDAVADMLEDDSTHARDLLSKPFHIDDGSKTKSEPKAPICLKLAVASGYNKVLCGSGEFAAAPPSSANAAATPKGGAKSSSPKSQKTKDAASAEAKRAERKAKLAADTHVVRFISRVPTCKPTVYVRGVGISRGAWRFDVRLRQDLLSNECIGVGWSKLESVGHFDWSQGITVGKSPVGSTPSQSCGIYLYGNGRVEFAASLSSGGGQPTTVIEELRGIFKRRSSNDSGEASVAPFAKAGSTLSCLIDVEAKKMHFVVLDADRRQKGGADRTAGFRVRAQKHFSLPEGIFDTGADDNAGFTAVISGMGRAPVAGSKDAVFDEDKADQSVLSCAVLLTDADLAAVPFSALQIEGDSSFKQGEMSLEAWARSR